jgi:hypothetical protein
MIYKFKSMATGDTLMLAPQGDQMLRLIGREPSAKGIIEVAAMAAAIAAIQRAVADDDAARRGESAPGRDDDTPGTADKVSLRQRMWPMVEMLKQAQAASEPIVWGV